MNVLFWMFGLAALSAVLPILFHLIQRTPQGRQAFSSLMFLRPVPPRFTKRSRINHWLLLLLRILALLLITVAFMRPFLSQSNEFWDQSIPQKRVAILLDASASMRRESLWPEALKKVEQVLEKLETGDDFAIFRFDDQFQTILGFDDTKQLQTLTEKRAAAIAALRGQSPSWGRTDLGGAIVQAIEWLEVAREYGADQAAGLQPQLQIEVISDAAASVELEPLRQMEWPETVRLQLHTMSLKNPSNASLQILLPDESQDELVLPRLRLRNYDPQDPVSVSARWVNGPATETSQAAESVDVQLAPLANQSVELSVGKFELSQRFSLTGDAHAFDNDFYIAPRDSQTVDVWIVDDAPLDDPANAMYYLRQALVDSSARKIQVTAVASGTVTKQLAESTKPLAVFVRDALDESDRESIDRYLRDGGLVQWCVTTSTALQQAAAWRSEIIPADTFKSDAESRSRDEYKLLVDLDFRHPLLRIFGQSTFNDFTTIRFWKHLPLAINLNENTSVLARFDDATPAMWVHRVDLDERNITEDDPQDNSRPTRRNRPGQLIICNFGWHPDDSQLAMSSKFVIWVNQLVDWALQAPPLSRGFTVYDSIDLNQWFPEATEVRTPKGEQILLSSGSQFSATDEPGIYSAIGAEGTWNFAVNIDRSESESRTLELSELETLGVLMGNHPTQSQQRIAAKAKIDRESEQQQKLWKWFLLAAIVVLIFETVWAARINRVAERALNAKAVGG